MKTGRKKFLHSILNLYIGVGVLLWIVAALFILAPVLPTLAYRLYPDAKANEIQSLTGNIDQDYDRFQREEQPSEPLIEQPVKYEPEFDPSLPTENRLIIPKIGVDTVIQEGDDWNAALELGPWRVNNFADPTSTDVAPMIMASHRFGIVGWTGAERTAKSFYSLPNLENGDTIEIIWNQRKYIYTIYSGEENTEITDYSADLILYTCKLIWESPTRIFRYAQLEEV